MNYVFYKGTLHSEYEPPLKSRLLPEFSWVFNAQQRRWYYLESRRVATHVNSEDVPAEYRAHILLINP